MWWVLGAVLAVGILAVCSAHIPILRDLTGAAPLDDGEVDAAVRRHPAGRDLDRAWADVQAVVADRPGIPQQRGGEER